MVTFDRCEPEQIFSLNKTGPFLTEYKAGEIVHGTVYLNVTKSDQRAQALVLQVVGRKHAVVHYTTSETHRDDDSHHTRHHDHYDESTNDFLRIECPIHRFDTQLVPGQFEFPFSIQLPPDLPIDE
jgi:hypothetical protein